MWWSAQGCKQHQDEKRSYHSSLSSHFFFIFSLATGGPWPVTTQANTSKRKHLSFYITWFKYSATIRTFLHFTGMSETITNVLLNSYYLTMKLKESLCCLNWACQSSISSSQVSASWFLLKQQVMWLGRYRIIFWDHSLSQCEGLMSFGDMQFWDDDSHAMSDSSFHTHFWISLVVSEYFSISRFTSPTNKVRQDSGFFLWQSWSLEDK